MKEKIIAIIRNACALEEQVDENSELATLSLDSLSFVGVIVEMEEQFGVEFDIDELGVFDWKTVADIIKNVEEKLHEKD